jgi:hypothetical protein
MDGLIVQVGDQFLDVVLGLFDRFSQRTIFGC